MRKSLLVLALLAIVTLVAGTAMADTVTLTQGTFTAVVTTTATTASITFGGGLTSDVTSEVAIHVANGATVTGGLPLSAGWTFQNGLNSVNCGGTGNWFCAVNTANVSFAGLTLTWNYTGGSLISPISAQFAVCSPGSTLLCAPGPNTNFITNFSQSGPTTTPEPATFTLLGAGSLGLGGLIRRRK